MKWLFMTSRVTIHLCLIKHFAPSFIQRFMQQRRLKFANFAHYDAELHKYKFQTPSFFAVANGTFWFCCDLFFIYSYWSDPNLSQPIWNSVGLQRRHWISIKCHSSEVGSQENRALTKFYVDGGQHFPMPYLMFHYSHNGEHKSQSWF